MSLTTAKYPALTDDLQRIFTESAKVSMENMMGRQIYDFVDTNRKTYDHLTMYGLPGMSGIAEGQELPTVTSQEGDSLTITQRRHGNKISITKDMRMFDLYNQIKQAVKSSVDTSFNQWDQALADLILNGFTGTSYADVFGFTQSNLANDGVVLFSASHTNNVNSGTARNLIRSSAGTDNPALTRDPVFQAITDAMNYQDPNSVNRPINLDELYVSPKNADLAERIVYSTGVVNTPNVDINPIKGRVKKVYTWSKLTTSGQGTDTSAYWSMCDSSRVKDSLLNIVAQPIKMHDAENVTETQNWLYPVDAYFALRAAWPFGIWGSTGAN